MMHYHTLHPDSFEYVDYEDYDEVRHRKAFSPEEALLAVRLRIKHVVDERPKNNVIFEVDSDISEDALVKVVEKLSSKFARIDVLTHDDELLHLVVGRLRKELEPTTVDQQKGATTMKGTWRQYHKTHDYSLTVGALTYFVRANFERDVVFERRVQNRVMVLYRTEQFLEGEWGIGGVLEAAPLDTIDLQITPLLRHIYRVVGVLDDREVLRRLRSFAMRYADDLVYRFLDTNMEKLMGSARVANSLEDGTHFAVVNSQNKSDIVVTAATEREHLGIKQFLQIHHDLPVTPLRIATVQRSPLHMLKSYSRVMGVFRRGGYELRQWLTMRTQIPVRTARVYPLEWPVKPIYALPASATISEWIVRVESKMGFDRKIPQEGVRLIVCPSTPAMRQLWRYLKYSHDEIVSLTNIFICTGPTDELERAMFERKRGTMSAVLTTAAHFETWHTRYICNMDAVTVLLGTPTSELQYLHRAYRFARPVTNVITVPLDPRAAERNPYDSGIESDSSGSSSSHGSGLSSLAELSEWDQKHLDATRGHPETSCAPRGIELGIKYTRVCNRSEWATIFMKEMWGLEDYKKELSCPEDAQYEKCVKWMQIKWREKNSPETNFDAWSERMLQKYRDEEFY